MRSVQEYVGDMKVVVPRETAEQQQLLRIATKRSKFSEQVLRSLMPNVMTKDTFLHVYRSGDDIIHEAWKFEAASPEVIVMVHNNVLELCSNAVIPEFVTKLIENVPGAVFMVLKNKHKHTYVKTTQEIHTESLDRVGSIIVFRPDHRSSTVSVEFLCTFQPFRKRRLASRLTAVALELSKRVHNIRYAIVKPVSLYEGGTVTRIEGVMYVEGGRPRRGSYRLFTTSPFLFKEKKVAFLRTKLGISLETMKNISNQPLLITMSSDHFKHPDEEHLGAPDYELYFDMWEDAEPQYTKPIKRNFLIPGYVYSSRGQSLEMVPVDAERQTEDPSFGIASESDIARASGRMAVIMCSLLPESALLEVLRQFGNELMTEFESSHATPYGLAFIKSHRDVALTNEDYVLIETAWENKIAYMKSVLDDPNVHENRKIALFANICFHIGHLVAQNSVDVKVLIGIVAHVMSSRSVSYRTSENPYDFDKELMSALILFEIERFYTSGNDFVGTATSFMPLLENVDFLLLRKFYDRMVMSPKGHYEIQIEDDPETNFRRLVWVVASRFTNIHLAPTYTEISGSYLVQYHDVDIWSEPSDADEIVWGESGEEDESEQEEDFIILVRRREEEEEVEEHKRRKGIQRVPILPSAEKPIPTLMQRVKSLQFL